MKVHSNVDENLTSFTFEGRSLNIGFTFEVQNESLKKKDDSPQFLILLLFEKTGDEGPYFSFLEWYKEERRPGMMLFPVHLKYLTNNLNIHKKQKRYLIEMASLIEIEWTKIIALTDMCCRKIAEGGFEALIEFEFEDEKEIKYPYWYYQLSEEKN